MTTAPHHLVLGKFLPLHVGHLHLIAAAGAHGARVTVVLGPRWDDPIPAEVRWAWLVAEVPTARIVTVSAHLPSTPDQAADFWEQWTVALHAAAGSPVDAVFSSERYGEEVARRLGARHVCVDLPRQTHPVSGTALRADLWGQWAALAPAAQSYFQKTVAVVGPESTGKSTLAAALATAVGGVSVPEYGRTYTAGLTSLDGWAAQDAIRIATAQQLLVQQARASRAPVIVSDTDPIVTAVWTELAGQPVPEALWASERAAPADFYLLCEPDLPWVQDGSRLAAESRDWFAGRVRAHLNRLGRPYAIVEGVGQARLASAQRHLADCAERWWGDLRRWETATPGWFAAAPSHAVVAS